jgi:hypothetical protein
VKLFGFLKKEKKDPIIEYVKKMTDSIYPKGEKDINAGTSELLFILDNKIDRESARSILIKSVMISRLSPNFNKERLKSHLAGYCLQHFNDNELDKYYNYLVALTMAMLINRKPPSEVIRDGNSYVW